MVVRLLPLGGLGEFGANALLIEAEPGRRLLVDAGASFSELEPFGVAYEVPDFAALAPAAPEALLVTHAHDDHARGVPQVVAAFPEIVVAASRATAARLRRAVDFADGRKPEELPSRSPFELAGVATDVIPVSHSIPGGVIARFVCDVGTAVFASDFRLAPSALGETTSLDALTAWGDQRVDLLLLDSTNAFVPGPLVEESLVAEALEELIAGARGAVVGVTFASHLGRFCQLARAAVACGRVVVPVGRGLDEALAVQADLGGLGLPPGSVRPLRSITRIPREQLVLVATGSQGEAGSGLARIAGDQLAGFALHPGDLVLHCARVIPGSERRVAELFDHCVRRGARVVTAAEAPTHVSGHPPRDELATVISLLRPRFVVPLHGRRRNLEAVAELARTHGCRAVVVENGAELSWRAGSLAPTGEFGGVGRILFEDPEGVELDPVALRQRRALGRNGLIVASFALSSRDPGSVADPEIHLLGLDLPAGLKASLARDLGAEARRARALGSADAASLRSTMGRLLRSEVRRQTGRRPVTVVLISEL